MFIGGCRDIRLVNREHLSEEAISRRLGAELANNALDSVFAAAPPALEEALMAFPVGKKLASYLRNRMED